jgi:hypothetical protein
MALDWAGYRGARCRHDVCNSHVALWANEASDSSARQLSPAILKEKAPTLIAPGKPGNLDQKSADPKPTPPSLITLQLPSYR